MATWIWKFGDFEIYHSSLLHNRRQELGKEYPSFWKLYAPEPFVRFRCELISKGGLLRVATTGTCMIDYHDKENDVHYRKDAHDEIVLPKGRVWMQVTVGNPGGLPSLYLDGPVETNGNWECDDITGDFRPVGTWDALNSPDQNPQKFPFVYDPINWVSKEPVEGGVLYDFGKATFCRLRVVGGADQKRTIRLGESREEAMDDIWCMVRFDGDQREMPASAFRYIFVSDPDVDIQAEYEYLPMNFRGAFRCGEEVVDWVWDTAAYTFHLNSREFFLDGIKRDRWVWSGDAYQSQFVNHYLFMDQEIEKRTLIGLGGQKPFKQHINTIMDYTFYWFMGIYEYYLTYGDKQLLEQLLPQMEEIMAFCLGRRSEDGFMRGKPFDWVFIDWANLDKTGALFGEQVLFAQAMADYSKIRQILGLDGSFYDAEAAKLREKIQEFFYDADRGVFIDSYESGKKNVTRHSNILAYLYLPCTQAQKDSIYKNVLCNDTVPAITTPYFKFYENRVLCEAGDMEGLEKCIREYYGAMRALGATSLYEQFDPTCKGAEHYAMYDKPYGKSLCHAWSASPIYLLGRYRMGVKNTGIAYDTFEVKPMPGTLPPFEGVVPLPKGEVRVKLDKTSVTVCATAPGGTLILGDRQYPLIPNQEITATL